MPISLSAAQLIEIMPGLSSLRAGGYLPLLLRAMEEAKIDTPLRAAAFLAQIGHESYSLKFMEEIWGPTPQQMRYDPPSPLAVKLGNTQKGDGFRYKGRGPIQLTGRANYRACGRDLSLDLENHPELAATPGAAFRVAAWFWTTRQLNALADASNFEAITRTINGGSNGAEDRNRRYTLAKRVFGLEQAST